MNAGLVAKLVCVCGIHIELFFDNSISKIRVYDDYSGAVIPLELFEDNDILDRIYEMRTFGDYKCPIHVRVFEGMHLQNIPSEYVYHIEHIENPDFINSFYDDLIWTLSHSFMSLSSWKYGDFSAYKPEGIVSKYLGNIVDREDRKNYQIMRSVVRNLDLTEELKFFLQFTYITDNQFIQEFGNDILERLPDEETARIRLRDTPSGGSVITHCVHDDYYAKLIERYLHFGGKDERVLSRIEMCNRIANERIEKL